MGDGDGVTEGVGVEDGIGVTEGVGVSVNAGVPSGVEGTVGVGDSSDAITFSESEAAGKVFSVSVMHESSSPELKISSKLSGVPNSAACTGTVADQCHSQKHTCQTLSSFVSFSVHIYLHFAKTSQHKICGTFSMHSQSFKNIFRLPGF